MRIALFYGKVIEFITPNIKMGSPPPFFFFKNKLFLKKMFLWIHGVVGGP